MTNHQVRAAVSGPAVDDLRPTLLLDLPPDDGTDAPLDGVVLVLHGGRAHSLAPTAAHQLAVLRMIPFARAAARATRAQPPSIESKGCPAAH